MSEAHDASHCNATRPSNQAMDFRGRVWGGASPERNHPAAALSPRVSEQRVPRVSSKAFYGELKLNDVG